jgi:filamentous hemagglutinin family protein
LLASLQIFLPTIAAALPTDGHVVAGQATIHKVSPTTLSITQASDKAILNWNSFSIAANEAVRFTQPSVYSIALNRVIGVDPSVILGQLQANGRIFLINPNGILFGAGAQVNVGGLLATTLQIRDDDFMAGRYLFAQNPLKGLKTVVNRGSIQISDNGFVVLMAPGVSNEGVIVANLGTALLGSGQKFTLDLMGDGLIRYAINDKVLGQVTGPDSKPLTSAVNNSGSIQADGGQVILQAKAAGDVFSSVVNQSGVIRAHSLENHGGIVKLIGGDETLATATDAGAMRPAGEVSGAVVNHGTIDIAAGEPHASPGSVTIVGERVGQYGSIMATGAEGTNGGDVVITSTTRTILASGSTIDVSGSGRSSGGRLHVWSDQDTFFNTNATILARGGELGGNGGFIEISAKDNLGYSGTVNALAPFGSAGTLLLDPRNITIRTAGGSAYNPGANNLFGNTPGTDVIITPASINAAAANVVLQANNDITVTNAIAMTNNGVGITMRAGRDININANVTTNNGNIALTANDASAFGANRLAGTGDIVMAAGTALNAGNGNISLMIGPSAVAPFNPGGITARALTTTAGTISLQSTTASTVSGNVSLGSGLLSLNNAGAMTISGVVSGTGGLTKTGAGTLTLSGNNTYTGATTINAGTLTLGAANRIANASAVTVNVGATFNLNNFAETVGSLSGAGIVTLGSATLTTGGNNTSTTFSGVMSGTGGLSKAGTGTFTLSGANTYTGATTINAGTLRLSGGSAIANTSAVTLANVAGATLDLNGTNETIGSLAGGGAIGGNVTLGTGSLTTGVATNTTYSGIISGTGGLTKQGTGTFTLSGVNTYSGATTINAGTLRLGAANRIPDSSAVVVNAGTFSLNNFSDTVGSIAGAGAVNLGTGTLSAGGNNTSTIYSGVMSGTGGLTKLGTGTLTLSGNNTYTGATTINAGTLQLGAANRIANASAVTVAAGSTFNLGNFAETIGSLSGAGDVTLGSAALITGNATNTTFSGVMSGTGGLTKAGTGTFTLSGANTYTGTTTISAGTLRVAGGAAIADTSAVTLANVAGATLDLNGTNETIGSLAGGGGTGGNVTLGAGTLTTGGNNSTTTYSGVLSGVGGKLVKEGTGTFTLAGNNTYSGATTINVGAISINADNRLGTAPGVATAGHLTLNGGTLQTTGSFALNANRGIALSGSGGTVNSNAGTTLTYNGIIAGPATSSLTKIGTGTLVLGGANTYTGATNINAGTLTLGAANRLADPSAVTVAGGATFNLNNFSETVGSLSGAGNVTLGSGTLTTGGDNTSTTYSGIMSGTGGLTKAGTGTFSLSGANTYSGATNVNAGTLVAAANNALGTAAGGTAVASGASLGFSGGISYSTAEAVTLNGGTLSNLVGNNAFAGPITLAANSAVTIADGTTMTVGGTVNGGSQLTISSGTGGINFLSAIGGTTPLSSLTATVGSISLGPVTTVGAQTYTGVATLNGDLTTTNGTITLNSPVTLGANTTLSAGAGSISFGDTLNGSFSLTANSTGTTTFGGPVGNTTPLTNLTTNTGGTTAIDGSTVTTSGNQTYNDNVTMGQATTLISTGGVITFGGNATNNAAGAGITVDAATVNLTGGTTIATTGNGSISFFTDALNSNGANINVGTGTFALAPNLPTRSIEFGDVNSGRVTDVYYSSNFGSVTAGSFTIGRPTHTGNIYVTGIAAAPSALTVVNGGAGSVTFENAPYVSGNQNLGVVSGSGGINIGSNLTLGTGTLRMTTAGILTQAAGSLTASTAGLSAAGDINLPQSTNNVTTLAAQTTAGGIVFSDVDGFSIGAVAATGLHPAITGLTANAGNITLQGGGAVTQTQRILASTLSLQGNGPFTLTNNSNDVTAFSVSTTGSVQYSDANALVLGASTVSGNFDVTTGGPLTQSGPVTIAGTTTLAAVTNDITLTNAANDFNVIGVTSGNNVTLTDANTLTMNASTVSGNLSGDATDLTIAGAVDSTGGNIGLTGANTVTQLANLSANGANPVAVTATGGPITMAPAATTTSGTGSINYTAGTDVTLGSLSTGGAVNVIANGGSVFSAVGSATNLTAGANSTLQAFNGVVGTQAAPVTVAVNPGTLGIRATTAIGGISAFLTGTVFPSNTLTLLNSPPGLVCFNGCPVPSSPVSNLSALATSTFGYLNPETIIPAYYPQPSQSVLISDIASAYMPGTLVQASPVSLSSGSPAVQSMGPKATAGASCSQGGTGTTQQAATASYDVRCTVR